MVMIIGYFLLMAMLKMQELIQANVTAISIFATTITEVMTVITNISDAITSKILFVSFIRASISLENYSTQYIFWIYI